MRSSQLQSSTNCLQIFALSTTSRACASSYEIFGSVVSAKRRRRRSSRKLPSRPVQSETGWARPSPVRNHSVGATALCVQVTVERDRACSAHYVGVGKWLDFCCCCCWGGRGWTNHYFLFLHHCYVILHHKNFIITQFYIILHVLLPILHFLLQKIRSLLQGITLLLRHYNVTITSLLQ